MRSKKTLLFVGILLLLGALVVATGGLGTISDQAEVVAEDLRSQAGQELEEPTFVSLGRFTVPIVTREDVAAHINVAISLELTSPAHVETVAAARRELRDAFIRDLSAAAYWPDHQSGNHLPARAMKRRLRAVSDRVLGPGVVREVLVASMVERRF